MSPKKRIAKLGTHRVCAFPSYRIDITHVIVTHQVAIHTNYIGEYDTVNQWGVDKLHEALGLQLFEPGIHASFRFVGVVVLIKGLPNELSIPDRLALYIIEAFI